MTGILDIGPNLPQKSYIQKRCKMVKGKTPQQAIQLMYVDTKGNTVRYKPSDLNYDLNMKFLVRVDTSNSVNEEGDLYDFACIADVQEYFHKEALTCPEDDLFQSQNEDIQEMAMWATNEHLSLIHI